MGYLKKSNANNDHQNRLQSYNIKYNNNNDSCVFDNAYTTMFKNAKNDDDILKIYEIYIKKNTSRQFALKLVALETFIQTLFSTKLNNNLKNRSIYYYSNDILVVLIKQLDRDYRIELLIYDFIQKYGKFLTALKMSRFGYSPLNTLCWTSRKLPASIFNNIMIVLHNIGFDIFMENKMGETCIESLINKLRSDNKFTIEIFTQRYLSLINLTERQVLYNFKTSMIQLITHLDYGDENLINKHLNRLIFCFYKNFHACYNTLIFRLSSLTTKDKELETIKKILILINNKNINKDFLQNSTLHELYFYFVYNNKEIIKSSLDFTLLINSIQIN